MRYLFVINVILSSLVGWNFYKVKQLTEHNMKLVSGLRECQKINVRMSEDSEEVTKLVRELVKTFDRSLGINY